MGTQTLQHRLVVLIGLVTAALAGCSGGGGDEVVILGDFPVAYVQRQSAAAGSPTEGVRFRAGGDLLVKRVASASAVACNITAGHTRGAGDVSDPEVSYEGDRLLFSMRGPDDASWNIFEYTWADSGDICNGALRRVIADDGIANVGDDVDPVYLPDGRIVFSSNRQSTLRKQLVAAGRQPFASRDEYQRERAVVLHRMESDGTEISQISFNQSHDRNPTVLSSGELLFARWEHVGGRNHFPLFFANPDGTNMFVLYGAFSPGNSFLHPREMPDGRILSSLMPLSGTEEGGALMVIDKDNFADNSHPVDQSIAGPGQSQASLYEIPLGGDPSSMGRFTTPYPLWDGTNRALVSWRVQGELVEEIEPITGEIVMDEGPPAYGVYMLDFDDRSQRVIALPAEGMMLTDPLAVMPRELPNVVADKQLDATLAAAGKGILNVKSVYDTDFLDIMGNKVLIPGEQLPRDAGDNPDLAYLKDPAQSAAADRPARFVRLSQAEPTPPRHGKPGLSAFEMQRLLGYAPIEPDGSFRIEVPADTPLGLVVVDAEGRALQTHTNWIQVRPGETRTCNGCHSPRRGTALNAPPVAGLHPNVRPAMAAGDGESMAETRTRIDPSALQPTADPEYVDVWTDPNVRTPDAPMALRYGGNADPADDLPAALLAEAPTDGVFDYVKHIQPLWDANCVSCHSGVAAAAELDLSASIGGSGRPASYDALLIGDPVIDPQTGLPEISVNDGVVVLDRLPGLVSVGGSSKSARSSHLVERLYETELRAADATDACAPDCQDHRGLLNAAERRLVAEWIDLGANLRNDPYVEGAGDDGYYALDEIIGGLQNLSEERFISDVQPLLLERCAGCHQPFGDLAAGLAGGAANLGFIGRRFILTGNAEGDFNAAVIEVGDVCAGADNSLLARPAATETDYPPHPSSNGQPLLPAGDPAAQPVLDWIAEAAALQVCL